MHLLDIIPNIVIGGKEIVTVFTPVAVKSLNYSLLKRDILQLQHVYGPGFTVLFHPNTLQFNSGS